MSDMGASEIRDGLYISDIAYVDRKPVSEIYDEIITLCRGDPALDTDCPAPHRQFGLWDDDVQQQSTFDRAVEATIEAIESDGDVLVHCMAGQSRSPAVVATALASTEDVHFDEARDEIWRARPQITINPALRAHGLEYLGQTDRKPFSS